MISQKARTMPALKEPLLHYPSFAELPNELISLQELVTIVNAAHAGLPLRARNRHKEFTTSMASNYVKQKLTPPPVGKKYSRLHVCMILFAATIKLAYSTEDVLDITRYVFSNVDDDTQLRELQDQLAQAFNAKTNDGIVSSGSSEAGRDITEALIDFTSSAFAQKVRSLVLI